MSLISKLHKSIFLGAIFHTLDFCLQRELSNCESVLDLGCGPSSPLRYCENIKYSLGIEAFEPYLEESRRKKIHTEYLSKKIEELDFPENNFDAVIMVEVLEHLSKEVGLDILKKAEKWASKKVILSTPNGYFPMDEVDNNKFQRHLSGWNVKDFKRLGYRSYGISGAKFFYNKKNAVHSLVNSEDFFSNIRFKPKKIFYVINAFFQIFTHYFPRWSFGLFAVKIIHDV